MSYSVWYHGTMRENVANILVKGLCSKHLGTHWQGLAWLPYHVLGKTRHQATVCAAEGSGAILTVHVSDDARDEYLTCDDSCYWCHGNESGLIKPLLPRMIADIENVREPLMVASAAQKPLPVISDQDVSGQPSPDVSGVGSVILLADSSSKLGLFSSLMLMTAESALMTLSVLSI